MTHMSASVSPCSHIPHPLPMRELMPVYAYTRLTTFHSEHCSASHVSCASIAMCLLLNFDNGLLGDVVPGFPIPPSFPVNVHG